MIIWVRPHKWGSSVAHLPQSKKYTPIGTLKKTIKKINSKIVILDPHVDYLKEHMFKTT